MLNVSPISKMAETLWKDCAQWLTKIGVLREDHRIHWPDAQVIHLAQSLRDGVLLCHLITRIDPAALDRKDVCQRPQMAQFLCLKNIRVFLQACKKSFDLKEVDLFEPSMLFDYTDFGKVLHTLSKLSNTPKALELRVEGFPAVNKKQFYEDDIYKNLDEIENEEHASNYCGQEANGNLLVRDICAEYCDYPTDDNIYEDLCSFRLSQSALAPSLTSQPIEKRDFSIKEIVETEKRYVDVLEMIKQDYIRPLYQNLTEEDRKIIFFGIKELSDTHIEFHSNLLKASHSNGTGLRIADIFLQWKSRFLLYGEFCANLPKAQQQIDNLCSRNDAFQKELDRCQAEAKDGRFKLKDLISVPLQRVLKYHLLLKELLKHTPTTHTEYKGLEKACEAMVDLAEYCNEVTRDNEHLEIIANVQASIADWNTVECGSLMKHGRLLQDGELKIKCHEDSNVKQRFVFLFHRTVIFCKTNRGDQYNCRLHLPLIHYRIEDASGKRTLGREGRWTHQWLLVHKDNTTAYTLYAKSSESKRKWMNAFKEALEAIEPPESRLTDHDFEFKTFDTTETCVGCGKYLKGVFFQGYVCVKCSVVAHRDCITSLRGCGLPPQPPPRPKAEIVKTPEALPSIPCTPYLNLRVESYPWYAGEMERETAAAILENAPSGTFLIRARPPPTRPNEPFALSLKHKNGEHPKHMRVLFRIEHSGNTVSGMYYLSDAHTFRSVVELVKWYETNTLRESFNGLDITLDKPWKHVFRTAVVLSDYESSDTSILSLSKGEHIIIEGKDGDATGWWRGRRGHSVGFFPKNYVVEDSFYQQQGFGAA